MANPWENDAPVATADQPWLHDAPASQPEIGKQPASLSGAVDLMGDQAKRAIGAAWDTISSVPNAAFHPIDTLSKAFDYTTDAIGRVKAAVSAGDKKEAAMSAIGAIPLAGPQLEQITREVDQGNYAEAIGHAAAARAIAEVPGAISKAAPSIAKAADIATKEPVVRAAVSVLPKGPAMLRAYDAVQEARTPPAAAPPGPVNGPLRPPIYSSLAPNAEQAPFPVGPIQQPALAVRPAPEVAPAPPPRVPIYANLPASSVAEMPANAPILSTLPSGRAPLTAEQIAAKYPPAAPAAAADSFAEGVAKDMFGKPFSKLTEAEQNIVSKIKPKATVTATPAPVTDVPREATASQIAQKPAAEVMATKVPFSPSTKPIPSSSLLRDPDEYPPTAFADTETTGVQIAREQSARTAIAGKIADWAQQKGVTGDALRALKKSDPAAYDLFWKHSEISDLSSQSHYSPSPATQERVLAELDTRKPATPAPMTAQEFSQLSPLARNPKALKIAQQLADEMAK